MTELPQSHEISEIWDILPIMDADWDTRPEDVFRVLAYLDNPCVVESSYKYSDGSVSERGTRLALSFCGSGTNSLNTRIQYIGIDGSIATNVMGYYTLGDLRQGFRTPKPGEAIEIITYIGRWGEISPKPKRRNPLMFIASSIAKRVKEI